MWTALRFEVARNRRNFRCARSQVAILLASLIFINSKNWSNVHILTSTATYGDANLILTCACMHSHMPVVNVCMCCLVHLVCPSIATFCSLLHLLQASPFDMRRQRRREAPTAGEQLTPTSTVSNLTVIKIKCVIIAMLYVELFWLLLQDVTVT